MSRASRVGVAVAALIVLVVAFVALRPTSKDSTSAPAAAGTTAAADTTASATTSTPSPKPEAPELPVLTAAKLTKLRVSKGDVVRFDARSSTKDEIHVHGYDLMKEAPAGRTVRVSFTADIDGIFEIEFEDAGKQIAQLRVDP